MSNVVSPTIFINYISEFKKCFVTRQNQPIQQKFKIDSSINDSYYFQIINSNNQVVSLSGRSFQIYGSLVDAKGQTHILFYTGNGDVDTTTNVIHFRINTFTQQYLNNIQTNKIADVTIVETTGDTTNVVLRDKGIFYKRAYVGDVPPGTVYDAGFGLKLDGSTFVLTGTVLSGDNSTIEINNNVINYIGPSGNTYTAGEGIGISDQNVISLTATIPLSTSQLTNDSGFALTSQIPTSASQLDDISAYYKVINTFSPLRIDTVPSEDQSSGKVMQMWIDTNTLSRDLKESYGFATTGMIPLSTSQLTNDAGYISSIILDIEGHDYNISSYLTFNDSFLYNEQYKEIRLNYPLVSARLHLDNYALTGQIPLSTSQLINDSGFLTGASVSNKESIYFDQHFYDNNEALQYVSGYNIIYTTNSVGGFKDLQPGAVTGATLSSGEVITFEQWCHRDDGFAAIDINGAYNNMTVIGDVPSSLPEGTTTIVLTRRLANINGTIQQFISYAYSF